MVQSTLSNKWQMQCDVVIGKFNLTNRLNRCKAFQCIFVLDMSFNVCSLRQQEKVTTSVKHGKGFKYIS